MSFQTYDKDKIDGLLKGKLTQVSTIPSPSLELKNVIVQYVGADMTEPPSCVNGRFYKCVEDEYEAGTYVWQETEIQNSDDYVHKNGEEVIAGRKTFGVAPISYNGYTANRGGSGYVKYGSSPLVDKIPEITYGDDSGSNYVNLPNKSGTVALTDDIPATDNFVNLTDEQTVGGTKTFSSDVLAKTQFRVSKDNKYVDYSSNTDGNVPQVKFGQIGLSGMTINFPNNSGTIALTSDLDGKANQSDLEAETNRATNKEDELATSISGKADNSSVVHKTGNETISDTKTFEYGNNTTAISGGSVRVKFQNPTSTTLGKSVNMNYKGFDVWRQDGDKSYSLDLPEKDGTLATTDDVPSTESFVRKTDIVDNLTDTSSNKPLSAKQGKTLNGFIGTLADLTTTAKDNLVKAINELKSKFSDYLPLTGGALTGKLTVKTGDTSIKGSNDTQYTVMAGGTDIGNGGYFKVYGKNCTGFKGQAEIAAYDGTNESYLKLLPEGKATINGSNILTESEVINNLTDTSTNKPLSAKQGNVLSNSIGNKMDGTRAYTGWSTGVTVTGNYNFNGHNGILIAYSGIYPIVCWAGGPAIYNTTEFTIDSYTYGSTSSLSIKTNSDNQFTVVIF